MTEKDLRATLRQFCADFDRKAVRRKFAPCRLRRVVLPLVLGSGLTAVACEGDVTDDDDDDSTTMTGTAGYTGTGDGMPAYGVGIPSGTETGLGGWGGTGGFGGNLGGWGGDGGATSGGGGATSGGGGATSGGGDPGGAGGA